MAADSPRTARTMPPSSVHPSAANIRCSAATSTRATAPSSPASASSGLRRAAASAAARGEPEALGSSWAQQADAPPRPFPFDTAHRSAYQQVREAVGGPWVVDDVGVPLRHPPGQCRDQRLCPLTCDRGVRAVEVERHRHVHPAHAPVTRRQGRRGERLVQPGVGQRRHQPAHSRRVIGPGGRGEPVHDQLRHPTLTRPTAADSSNRLPVTACPTTPSAPTWTWPRTAGCQSAPGPT